MQNKKTILAAAVLVALCGCRPSPEPAPAAPAPVVVHTVVPKRGPIARSVTLPTFRILALQEAVIYAKVPGYLKSLAVDKGDHVQAGQLLAEIEVPEIEADHAEFQAEAGVAKTNYERMAQAREQAPDLVVPQTVDDLRGQWEIAQAKLQRAQTLLQYARITAPFSGVITARQLDPGAYVPAGTTPIVTLMDFSRVRVQVYAPEAETPFVKDGLPARLTVDELPGKSFTGSVTRFAYALDEATKTMLTEIEIPNADADLRPGMYASVQLQMEQKQAALLLPAGAVSIEKTGSFVFVVADGKAKKTSVQTGFADGANIEVLGGLSQDQPVILLGKQTLNNDQPVEVK